MNVFTVSDCPVECARYLDDARLRKMLVETAQMLSTHGYGSYKPCYENHPATKWVGQWPQWTCKYMQVMHEEYLHRFGKTHASWTACCISSLFLDKIHRKGVYIPTDWPTCYNQDYAELGVFEAYRQTLLDKWRNDKRPPTWTKRAEPRAFALFRLQNEGAIS
jgi:hypothetical protein